MSKNKKKPKMQKYSQYLNELLNTHHGNRSIEADSEDDIYAPSISPTKKQMGKSEKIIVKELMKISKKRNKHHVSVLCTSDLNHITIADIKNDCEFHFYLSHVNLTSSDTGLLTNVARAEDIIDETVSWDKENAEQTPTDKLEWVEVDDWARLDCTNGGAVYFENGEDNVDYIAAILTNGEVVFSSDAVKGITPSGSLAIGTKVLSYLNTMLAFKYRNRSATDNDEGDEV